MTQDIACFKDAYFLEMIADCCSSEGIMDKRCPNKDNLVPLIAQAWACPSMVTLFDYRFPAFFQLWFW